MPKSYIITNATEQQLLKITAFQKNCPSFGPDGAGSAKLIEHLELFGDCRFYADIAYTKGWQDHTGLSISTITRRAQPLVEAVLSDPSWLGAQLDHLWAKAALEPNTIVGDFKFVYVGILRLLCSVQGQRCGFFVSPDKWFSEYDADDTGFFGINGCNGEQKSHTVPVNPSDIVRVVRAKKVVEKPVEMTSDSIYENMTTKMSSEDSEALVRKLMSEFGIVEKPKEDKYEKLYIEERKKKVKNMREIRALKERIKELEDLEL